MKKILISFLLLFTSTLILAQFTVSVPGATICSGTCATLTVTPTGGMAPYSYIWNSGTTIGSTVSLCPLSTTTYTVIASEMMGATASTIAVVTVNPNPTVTVPPVTICEGSCASLTASGGATYTWAPAIGLNTTVGTSVTSCPITTTTYTVVGTNPTGCTSSTTVVVTVHPKVIPVITGTTFICNGSATTLTTSGGGTYFWDTGATTPSITVTPSNTTTYTVTVATNGCTGSASVQVTVCVGIKEQTSINGIVKIYPNPFSDNATLTILSDKQNVNYSFELVDVLGKRVQSVNDISTKQFQISRNGLTNGIYFYKIYDSENLIGSGKVVIK